MTTLLDPSSRSLVLAVFSVFVVICLMLCIVTGADDDDRALVRSGSRRLRSWQQGIAMAATPPRSRRSPCWWAWSPRPASTASA